MRRTELLKSDRIGFRSEAVLPFGTELTVLQGAGQAGRPCLVSVSNCVPRLESIEPDSDISEGARLVVMGHSLHSANIFTYVALPADRLDEEAERIESSIFQNLLVSESDQ